MPFTLAHPAAVVPLRKKLALSALVVGSLAPDFHYFLDLGPHGHFSHSLKGAFLFCLPLGLGVLWVFQTVLKLPLISLAPESHRQRLMRFAKPFRWGPPRRFFLLIASLLVGIFSHLVWDACTHDHGFVVRNLPDLLRAPPLEELGSHRPLYDWLQLGSSLLGISLLIFWYGVWLGREPPHPVPAPLQMSHQTRTWVLWSLMPFAAVVSLCHGYTASHMLASRGTFVGVALITLMSLLFLEALGFSLWWWATRGRSLGGVPIASSSR